MWIYDLTNVPCYATDQDRRYYALFNVLPKFTQYITVKSPKDQRNGCLLFSTGINNLTMRYQHWAFKNYILDTTKVFGN